MRESLSLRNMGKGPRFVLLLCGLALTGWAMIAAFHAFSYPRPVTGAALWQGDPCAPPCWQGITPGQSDEAEVLRLLRACPFVAEGTVSADATEEHGIPLRYVYSRGRSKFPNYIYLRDDKVLRIGLYIDQGPTLAEVVEQLGPPEGVEAYLTHPERYAVVLEYPSRGMTLWSQHYLAPFTDFWQRYFVNDRTGKLEKGFRVDYVDFYVPAKLEDALRNAYLYDPLFTEQVMGAVHPWQGFGQIPLGWGINR